MDPVVHFEMPADDQKRAGEFYSKAFGWQPQQLGPEMGETGVGPRRKAGGATPRRVRGEYLEPRKTFRDILESTNKNMRKVY